MDETENKIQTRLLESQCQHKTNGWFQIMARSGIDSWHPIESYGWPLKFLTQEEADAYKDAWLEQKDGSWKAFSYAVES